MSELSGIPGEENTSDVLEAVFPDASKGRESDIESEDGEAEGSLRSWYWGGSSERKSNLVACSVNCAGSSGGRFVARDDS